MPSVTEKQRQLMAIAEHHPSQVSPKNRGVLKMSKQQLHDFASGPVQKASQKIQSLRRKGKKG